MSQTWFITGASRGLGTEIARAALRAGHRVVATGRKRADVERALGADGDALLALALDVTDHPQVKAAVEAAVARFGGIDVLVNNAGYGLMGFFEEVSPADIEALFATNVFGAFDVTRAVLPVMRAARRGHVFNVSSIAGLRGAEFASMYSASKFALEGFSESLSKDVAPFGIGVTIVEPGPFRTDFLEDTSMRVGSRTIEDYDARRVKLLDAYAARRGNQPGDPAKLGDALVRIADSPKPPLRFLAGAFAIRTADDKLAAMQDEFAGWRDAGIATDHDA